MTVLERESVDVQLVTIPNIELVSVGEWDASTGPATFSEQDLKAAIAALDDPAIKAPRLRIGHTPPNITPEESAGGFEEQPAFGRFVNLRLANNGTTIVGDAAGVPAWLAEILPSAYPSRSIEAYWNVRTSAGRSHDMVITSVALLGVSMPAVQTLEDLRLAYGAEIPDGVQMQFTGNRVIASRGEPMPERVSASVTYTDVRRSFYEDFATQDADRYWWWICDFVMDPATVIADDDEGGLWSVPYTISGNDVEWGEPVEVRIQYVETASGKVAAARMARTDSQIFTTAADSRPHDRVRAATTPNERSDVDISTLREQLEMPDATDEEVIAAAAERIATPPAAEAEIETETETPTAVAAAADEMTVTVDREQLAQLQADAKMGREARDEQLRLAREKVVDDAIKAGKFPPSRRDHYLTLMAADEKGTRDLIGRLAEDLIPQTERGGAPAETKAQQDDGWFPGREIRRPTTTAQEA